jgi:hypothetical protein
MKEEMSIVPLDAFKHSFSFISLPLASDEYTLLRCSTEANQSHLARPGDERKSLEVHDIWARYLSQR